jgi:hypothetical protein
VDEILKAVHSLKNGKSASADLISNEMLKKAVPVLIKPLHKLFNFIFTNVLFCIFPSGHSDLEAYKIIQLSKLNRMLSLDP